jgi:DNA-binding FadR family transcriptional regulator
LAGNDLIPKRRDETGTATAGVADELVRMILGLAPGSSIPSEAELAVRHGVSRVTVREAVKMVAGRGLLELARGRRAVVREPDAEALGQFMASIVQNDPEGMIHLTEARMSVEVQCAGLAAQRADAADIGAISGALNDMHRAEQRMDASALPDADVEFHAADVRFHEAVAAASKNRILVGVLTAMVPALQKSFLLTRQNRAVRGQSSEHVVHAHQRILDCIEAGDQAGAEAAMRVHLTDARRDLQRR